MSPPLARRSLLRFAIVAFLAVQLAVPIVALSGPRPTRFGWQMFTTHAPLPSAWVEQTDGSVRSVDLEGLLVHPRPEADLRSAIVSRLCVEPDAEAVTVEQHGRRTRVPCD